MADDDDPRDGEERDVDLPDEDDAEGQVFTWKLKQPSPEAQEDTEDTEDTEDAEGHGIGGVGSPLPPVN